MSEGTVTASSLAARIDTAAHEIEPQVVAWRRDFHANPSSATASSVPRASSPSI